VHKGRVIERVFSELGEDAAIAYLGDGRTDEDAFRALRGRGLSVLVRLQPRASLAVAWLRPPEELLSFLVAWGRACMTGGGD
jgi:trehalose-6-phosphatase